MGGIIKNQEYQEVWRKKRKRKEEEEIVQCCKWKLQEHGKVPTQHFHVYTWMIDEVVYVFSATGGKKEGYFN